MYNNVISVEKYQTVQYNLNIDFTKLTLLPLPSPYPLLFFQGLSSFWYGKADSGTRWRGGAGHMGACVRD